MMRSSTDWFREAKWGVFTHYLGSPGMTAEAWNQQVERFDVERLARQIQSTGARYACMTIGQNSGHYCSPNATYDALVGIQPGKCSRRDLIADLYEALHSRGIALMAYLPSGAPAQDPIARERLEWEWGFEGKWGESPNTVRTGKRLASFQRKWESVIREWSLRWGRKVAGWWIDGCYFSEEMYRHPDPPNFESLAASLKAGNPDGIVAFNPGVLTPVISLTGHEDYTAGEIAEAFPVCPGRWVDGAQYHILSYLGASWCAGEPRFIVDFVIGYTRDVNARGGVVTWDVPITSAGAIPQPFIDQLKALGDAA